MKYRIGDNVVVTTGRDKGASGKLLKIDQKNDRVLVEGLNIRVKHIKAKQGQPGDRVEFSAPIHISNIALLDAKTGKASRVGYKFENGLKVRVTKASGSEIVQKAPAAKKESKKTIKA